MKLLTTIVVATAALGVAATAQAGLTASGHVAYQLRDLDGNSDIDFQTNGFSESRYRLIGSKKVGSLKFGTEIEIGLGSGEGTGTADPRRNSFFVSGGFGKVSLGQRNDVGDGVINADLAGTNIVTALSSNRFTTGVGVNGFDPGRGEALRYYSPKLGGVAKVGVQLQENGDTEIALRADSNGFRFNAFVEDGDTVDKSGFLVGYKHSGFSITFVSSESGSTEHEGFKVGYATGKHKVSFSSVEKGAAEAEGIQYLYNHAKGVQFYAGTHEAENATGSDVNGESFVLGGRVKF